MTESTVTQTTEAAISRCPKCRRGFYKSGFAFGLICLVTSFVLLSLVFIFSEFCTTGECSRTSNTRKTGEVCGAISAILFLVGGGIMLSCHIKLKKHGPAQVVVSRIPEEDLEKSASPILPYCHIPDQSQSFLETSSIDLPDYFTIVQNKDDVGLPVNTPRFWTEDLDASDYENCPPPTYEQALKMSELAAASTDAVNTHIEQGSEGDTRL